MLNQCNFILCLTCFHGTCCDFETLSLDLFPSAGFPFISLLVPPPPPPSHLPPPTFEGWCILRSHFWLFCSTHFLCPLFRIQIDFLSVRPLIQMPQHFHVGVSWKYSICPKVNSSPYFLLLIFLFILILIQSSTTVHSRVSQKWCSHPVLFLHCSCLYQQVLLVLSH